MNANRWLNSHSVLMTILLATLSGLVWVLTSYATVDYVDKGNADTKAMMQEIRTDVKELLKRQP